jgi:methanol--5-hydroxybenzimidazolylcobamide Co-methyltransferase
MEGKSSACAHLSPIGNIAACVADLWSNESVQNIKLLGGMAPTVSVEQLAYDCRLMNTAAESGINNALLLRDWLCESDSCYDPQAYVLRPDVAIQISKEIIKKDTPFERSKVAAMSAIDTLSKAVEEKKVHISERETSWISDIQRKLDAIPDDVEKFTADMLANDESGKLDPKKYNL